MSLRNIAPSLLQGLQARESGRASSREFLVKAGRRLRGAADKAIVLDERLIDLELEDQYALYGEQLHTKWSKAREAASAVAPESIDLQLQYGTTISNAGFLLLQRRCLHDLRSLTLTDLALSPNTACLLFDAPQLETLRLRPPLTPLHALELQADGDAAAAAAVAQLSDTHRQLTEEALWIALPAALSALRSSLTCLDIRSKLELPVPVLAAMLECGNLRELALCLPLDPTLAVETVASLQRLEGLTLQLDCCPELSRLSSLSSVLTRLALRSLTPEGFEVLRPLAALRRLEVQTIQATAATGGALQDRIQLPPQLRELRFAWADVAALAALEPSEALRAVDAAASSPFYDAAAAPALALFFGASTVQAAAGGLRLLPSVSSACMRRACEILAGRLSSPTSLSVGVRSGDGVYLSGSPFDRGPEQPLHHTGWIAELHQLADLRVLVLGRLLLSEADMIALVRAVPNLQELSLEQCRHAPTVLRPLLDLDALTHVRVRLCPEDLSRGLSEAPGIVAALAQLGELSADREAVLRVTLEADGGARREAAIQRAIVQPLEAQDGWETRKLVVVTEGPGGLDVAGQEERDEFGALDRSPSPPVPMFLPDD